MRIVALMMLSIGAAGGGEAFAQTAATAETPEEIVVRGKRLAEFRLEVQFARERAYAIFNEINSSDDFDITCDSEMRTGTRVGREVCVARFEGRISSHAARDWLASIRWNCKKGNTGQDCMFDPDVAGYGLAAAQAVESEAPMQRDRLNAEIHRLARTDMRFGQAILDFYDASLKYEEERKRPRARQEEPRPDE